MAKNTKVIQITENLRLLWKYS